MVRSGMMPWIKPVTSSMKNWKTIMRRKKIWPMTTAGRQKEGGEPDNVDEEDEQVNTEEEEEKWVVSEEEKDMWADTYEKAKHIEVNKEEDKLADYGEEDELMDETGIK